MDYTKFFQKVFKLYMRQRLSQHIFHLFLCRNILELYNSLLYHIPNVLLSNFDMFQLVMKHRVFCQLNRTLITQRISVTSISASNNLSNILVIHTTSLQAEHVAMYSASIVLSEIPVCFLLNHEIIPDPKLKHILKCSFCLWHFLPNMNP